MLFGGKKETIDLSDPGTVKIDEHVASTIPDPGEYFLRWIGDIVDDDKLIRLKKEVDTHRGANGWLTSHNLRDVPEMGRRQEPLTFLNYMMGYQSTAAVAVWATMPRQGRELKTLGVTIESLVINQGYAAAITWAIASRPEHRFHLTDIQEALPLAWDEGLSWVLNKDIIKAFRNWN
jgi:hypothetical protein